MRRLPPRATLFPYTTLFRSRRNGLSFCPRRARRVASTGKVRDIDALAGTLAERRREKKGVKVVQRSEEHTSELQSHSDLVCRLLLEKKKEEGKGRGRGQERV